MAFENLSIKLSESLKKITKQDKITDKHLDELLGEVKRSLLEADVALSVVETLTEKIRTEALGQKVIGQLKANELLMKIVYDALVDLLGPSSPSLEYPKSAKIKLMIVGLQGSGKTTSVAKLANQLKKLNRKVLLVAADTQRPAAIDQLKILGLSIGVDVFSLDQEKNAIKVLEAAQKHFNSNDYDFMIVDTAGRLHVDTALMDELVKMDSLVKFDEILLSVDTLSGQDVIHVAKSFNTLLKLTGLVVTKFDSDAPGGAILSVKALTQVPVKFVGTGEKVDAFELFYPDRVANRLMGMGDLMSLVEVAQEKIDQMAAEKTLERMMEGTFTLSDMLQQFEQLSKMGSLKSMMAMLPGMGQMAQQVNDTESAKAISKSKAIIYSMTLEEREDPSLLRASRKNRIALGSGTSVTDVNRILSQYEKAKEQARMVRRLMKNNPNLK
jgi:signal recognition particle subunit SRP54